MSTPDPESMGLLGKVMAAAAAVVVPVWGARTWIENRFSKKADKESTEKATGKCLEHIEQLYQNAEEDRKQTRDLHDKAMERIQHNQTQLIDILSRR